MVKPAVKVWDSPSYRLRHESRSTEVGKANHWPAARNSKGIDRFKMGKGSEVTGPYCNGLELNAHGNGWIRLDRMASLVAWDATQSSPWLLAAALIS